MDLAHTALALVGATGAGWVDAVVGGGGLLQLPALLLAAPTAPVAVLLGTNKVASVAGTSTAALTYLRRTKVRWSILGPAVGLAVLCSGLGAALAGTVPARAYRPVVIVVLAGVALVVLLRPALGTGPGRDAVSRRRILTAIGLAGMLIATYDGAIGPGTGTFLILSFSTTLGVDFLHASAMAKAVNVATNVGALVVFALGGHVWWLLGLGMAIGNMLGARLGAHTALRRGSGFVRLVLLVVVFALLAKLAFDEFSAV